MARLSTLAAGRERLIAAGATADVVSRFLPGGLGANFEPYWETIGGNDGMMGMGIMKDIS